MTGKMDVSIPQLRDTIIRDSLRGTILFPDTGFITTKIQPSFWKAAERFSVGFSQMTVAELSGWCNKPHFNTYLASWLPRALKQCSSSAPPDENLFKVTRVLGSLRNELIGFEVAVAERFRFQRFGYDYYVDMLSLRKRMGIAAHRELKDKLGREPSEQELKQHLHNEYHPRVTSLAFKGWKDQGRRNYLADEELVVTAAMTAILTGRETMILTRDNDVFDQFVKLMQLFADDYNCYRFAEVHYLNPDGCPMFPIGFPEAYGPAGFTSDPPYHVVLPQDEVERLPPYNFSFVNAYCFLVGNSHNDPKISQTGFCLEREMGRLLEIKGATGGKNSERFGDKNMVSGYGFEAGKTSTAFFLTELESVEYDGVNVSRRDLDRGLNSDFRVVKKYFRPSFLTYPG